MIWLEEAIPENVMVVVAKDDEKLSGFIIIGGFGKIIIGSGCGSGSATGDGEGGVCGGGAPPPKPAP